MKINFEEMVKKILPVSMDDLDLDQMPVIKFKGIYDPSENPECDAIEKALRSGQPMRFYLNDTDFIEGDPIKIKRTDDDGIEGVAILRK